MTRAVLVAAVLLAAGLAAGCGGDDESSGGSSSGLTGWAGSFCTAFSTWGTELQKKAQTLTLSPSAETVQVVADDVRTATYALLDELASLGPPDTEASQDVLEAVDELNLILTEQISVIESTVESLSGPTGVSTTVPAISDAFATMRTASADALKSIEQAASGNELEDAFEQAPSCDNLTGS